MLCGVGIIYVIYNKGKKPKPKPIDTSKWTIRDWQLEIMLSVLILENPTILKIVNKETDAFKYLIEIRKNLQDDKKRQTILDELINHRLLLKRI
jgi:hypothetical protein